MRDRNQASKTGLCIAVLLCCWSTLPLAISAEETLVRKSMVNKKNGETPPVVREFRVVEGLETIVSDAVVKSPGERAMEAGISPLILRDVRLSEIPVMVSSSDNFVLEWTEREVVGEVTKSTEREYVLTTQPALPTACSLGQNYPNPFNPSTTIAFDLPGTAVEKQPVDLVIYDIRGHRVRTLIDSDLDPGNYAFAWNGRDDRGSKVSSGIYLYTLRAGGERFTRKMTILK